MFFKSRIRSKGSTCTIVFLGGFESNHDGMVISYLFCKDFAPGRTKTAAGSVSKLESTKISVFQK